MAMVREPWVVLGETQIHGVDIISGRLLIAMTCPDDCEPDELDKIHAARIVACVNACAGIPTETLEAGVRIEAADDKTQVWVNPKVPDDELA